MKYLIGLCLVVAVLSVMATPQTATTTANYSVIGKPSITSQHINNLLCSSGSPACGSGQLLYDQGAQYNIDPVFALAFFHHESTFGTQGVARLTLSLGNIRCTDGYQCIDGFRSYSRWDDGYRDWYQLIKYYIDVLGKRTLQDIIATYAPSSENDTASYISAIENDVSQWRAEVSA